MPNGTYGGVRGEKDSPLLDFYHILAYILATPVSLAA